MPGGGGPGGIIWGAGITIIGFRPVVSCFQRIALAQRELPRA